MKLKKKSILLACLAPLLSCCGSKCDKAEPSATGPAWHSELARQLPLLGHRNWIVVTDMAYPLQTNPGITTLYADAPYADVVGQVNTMIKQAPHVFAHIYQDSEQQRLSEQLAPGWDAYKASLRGVLDEAEVEYIPHEELIRRLDAESSLCRVVIIKTPLTLPYTSTFFNLDCGYWDADREARIRQEAGE